MKNILFRFPLLVYSIALLGFIIVVVEFKHYVESIIHSENAPQQNVSLLNTVNISIYTHQGTPRYALKSRELEYLIDSDDMRFHNVQVKRKSPNTAKLQITANQGKFDKQANQILLYDNVKIKRNAVAQESPQLLSTASVIIELNQDIAYTKEHVTLQEGKTRTEGVGMTADLNTSEIKLHSQTKVTHEK